MYLKKIDETQAEETGSNFRIVCFNMNTFCALVSDNDDDALVKAALVTDYQSKQMEHKLQQNCQVHCLLGNYSSTLVTATCAWQAR